MDGYGDIIDIKSYCASEFKFPNQVDPYLWSCGSTSQLAFNYSWCNFGMFPRVRISWISGQPQRTVMGGAKEDKQLQILKICKIKVDKQEWSRSGPERPFRLPSEERQNKHDGRHLFL